MNNTIPNVPRDWFDRVHALLYKIAHESTPEGLEAECLGSFIPDILSSPSPASCGHAACKSLGEPHPFCEFVSALDAAPSPAGVDGLEVMSNWVLFDAEADRPYIKKMIPEGFLAFFDCEEDARRAKANNPGTDYKRIDRVKAEDAHAIIDGLRGEVDKLMTTFVRVADHLHIDCEKAKSAPGKPSDVFIAAIDQQAQRIGELERLLLEVRNGLSCENLHHKKSEQHAFDEPCKVLGRIDFALSASKEWE